MAINAWWESDSAESFWMEITDRADVGADLHAPKLDGSGRDYWSYSLVQHVNEGDVVYHWWKPPGDEPGIVGYSRAAGSLQTSSIRWQAHGTVGRARGPVPPQPSWLQPLADFVELDEMFTQTDLRAHETGLKAARSALHAQYGDPLYFPFEAGEKRPPRAFQGYLVKMPRSVVEALGLPDPTSALPFTTPSVVRPTAPPAGAERRQADPLVRRAIEKHAVRTIEALLQAEGWSTVDVGDFRSYDIEATRADETLHVEVKGSVTSGVRTIELTYGEVGHARSDRTLLALVEGIEWEKVDGHVQTSGGTARLWWDWVPQDGHLVPTVYRYTLPAETW